MTKEQAKIYRNMPPGKKFKIMENMFWTARKMKEAFFRKKFPNLFDEAINVKVKESILYARNW